MSVNPKEGKTQQTTEEGGSSYSLGFIDKIVSFFLGEDDPEREKRQLLRDITKELKRQKLKFYKTRGEEAQPQLAKYFFDIYQIIGPAQAMIEHADSSGALKNIVIESHLNENLIETLNRVSEERIRERAEEEDPKELAKSIKDDLINFFAAFDNKIVREINQIYSVLRTFIDLAHFDYYFMLKKFDSSIPEKGFNYQPRFEAINGEYIVDDLKDFLEVMYPIDPNADWNKVFDILQQYKGMDVIARPKWKKILSMLKDLKKSRILELMIKHIDKDPYYKLTYKPTQENIVEPYLKKTKTQAELAMQKIAQERRNSKVEKLSNEIFGTTAISRMKNYTDKQNMIFAKKRLGGFIFIAPMNYLKAFILDYVKKDVKELTNMLLVRGKWSSNITSQQISDSFHGLLQISEDIIALDESVGEEGEKGAKIKNTLARFDRDKNSMTHLRQTLKEVNDTAKSIINRSAQNLIALGKGLKTVLDDYQNEPHELIINWKEIESVAERPLDEHIIEVYKKLYYFVQLLQIYMKSSKDE